MARIHLLPERVARKIAAGEVIERPASVVKELVENAFDAQAQRIEVEYEQGGLALIRVRDDGHGMDPEDLKRCYLPHATSKIRDEKDLLRINTWGFRGEALAAIASCARLTISSRVEGALLGARVKVAFGKEVSFRECGHPKGTVVEVEDLFANLPARKAFLKGPRAEGSRIVETVKTLCLENPETDLVLRSGKRVLFRYQRDEGPAGWLIRLMDLSPEKIIEEEVREGPYRLRIIFARGVSFPSSRHFYFLVNRRLVRDKILLSATYEGLTGAFVRGQYPALILYLFLAPELIDVNVHPAKAEVRFREEQIIYQLVRKTIQGLFLPKVAVSFQKETEEIEEDLLLNPLEAKEAAPEGITLWDQPFWKDRIQEERPPYGPKIRAIGPLGEEFYLCETERGLLILDFHAAHERLLFEELKVSYEKGPLKSQNLLLPEVLSLSTEAIERLEAHRRFLERLGFSFDLAGPQEVLVRSVPSFLEKEGLKALITLLEDTLLKEPGRILEETLATLACRAARKKGESPTPTEIEDLLRKILQRKWQTCPHGRPLFWEIDLEEIRKRLGRL